jgi:hypothetical protein
VRDRGNVRTSPIRINADRNNHGSARNMTNHSDPRTTKLYDRRKDLATLGAIERRIAFE